MVKHLNVVGLLSNFSQGIVSAGCASGLDQSKLFNLSYVAVTERKDLNLDTPEFQDPVFKGTAGAITNKPDWKALTVLCLPLEHYELVKTEGYKALITSIYSDKLPDELKKGVNNQKFDFIGTPSKFSYNLLKSAFPRQNVKHIPYAYKITDNDKLVDISFINPVDYWSNLIGYKFDDKTQVISSAGPFNIRKGHDRLVAACELVGASRPILLATSWYNPGFPMGFPHSIMHAGNYEPIVTKSGIYLYKKGNCFVAYLPRLANRSEMIKNFLNTDLYCAPSLVECWDMSLFDMMQNGALCAPSMNTAHLDYCNDNNCLPISADCSRASIVGAIDTAKSIAEDNRTAIIANAIRTCNGYTWSKTGKLIIEAFR